MKLSLWSKFILVLPILILNSNLKSTNNRIFNNPNGLAIPYGIATTNRTIIDTASRAVLLGSDNMPNDASKVLMKVEYTDFDLGEPTSLAPATVTFNGQASQENPLRNATSQGILDMDGNSNVLAVLKKDTDAGGVNHDGEVVYLVDFKDPQVIYSSATQSTKVALGSTAAGEARVFSAVTAGGIGTFRAHALPVVGNDHLENSGNAGLAAGFGAVSFMYWDSFLSRLYVCGTAGVNQSGIMGFKLNDDSSNLESLSPIGGGATAPLISANCPAELRTVHRICTLHTHRSNNTLNRSHLILQANNNPNVKNTFYSLLIVTDPDTTAHNYETGGVAQRIDHRWQSTDHTANPIDLLTIGNGPLSCHDEAYVTDIKVAGTTVFVSVAGRDTTAGADDRRDRGIYMSTAIVTDANRLIGWTTWERAGGTVEKTYAVGYNETSGAHIYLTDETAGTNDGNKLHITNWIDSSQSISSALWSTLLSEFPKDKGGIHQLFPMSVPDDFGPAGARTNGWDNQNDYIGATGHEKAIIKNLGTRQQGDPTSAGTNISLAAIDSSFGPFNWIEKYTANQNTTPNAAKFFVVGNGGSKTVDTATPPNITWPQDGTPFYKSISRRGDTNVPTTAFTYLMGEKKLVHVDNNGNTTDVVGFDNDEYVLDFALLDTYILIGTTKGLKRLVINANNGSPAPPITSVATDKIKNPVIQIHIEETRYAAQDFNIFILESDITKDTTNLWRYTEDHNFGLTLIRSIANGLNLRRLRRSIFPFTGGFYHLCSKHLDQIDLVDWHKDIYSDLNSQQDRNISLANVESAISVGRMIKLPSTGALVVYGEWGINVLE